MKFMYFEKYQLILENSEWSMIFNIADIWHKFSSGSISVTDFCNSYKGYLLKQKNNIIKTYGMDSWNKIEPLIQKLTNVDDEKKANSIFDSIYDWADNNEVLIQTSIQTEEF